MLNLVKIAVRNLIRQRRRTLLTASLITVGVVFVVVFTAFTGSFKSMIIGQITDSMIGHVQIHKKGFVASIDNLPLNMMIPQKGFDNIEKILSEDKEIEAYSPRIKFGGMFSNFAETTSIRLNAVYPDKEFKTVPLLSSRISAGKEKFKTINRGEIVIPELISKGMNVNIGDPVVVISTNKDGSVNGSQFIVAGIVEGVTGPGGRDGYMHFDDAVDLLRMGDGAEISEIAIRLKNFGSLNRYSKKLENALSQFKNKMGKDAFEVHTWELLTPFYNIARMIEVMTFFIKLMLIAIVLISIMNVMIMAVYERIREIGTIAAIGTLPKKILYMFLIEGLTLGVAGAVFGSILSAVIVGIANVVKIKFSFGRQDGLILAPSVNPSDMIIISAIVILVSIIASLQPALKASRMDPIKALRHL